MSSNKKILFITKSFYPNMGGVEKHVKKVSENLIKKGYLVEVYTSYVDKNISRAREKYSENSKMKIVEIKTNSFRFWGLIKIWLELLMKIFKINQFKIVHIHDVLIWYLPIRLILFWKPVYTTFHGWEGVYPIPRKNKLIRKISSKLSHKYIEIGEYIHKFYRTESGEIIYGATNLVKKIRKKRKNKIVYVGRLSKDTGLNIFLDFLRITKLKLVVEFCGDGDLINECRKYGKVHGFVDPLKYTKNANIVFASGYLTILEAFANQSAVLVAYDNSLKKSYFLDTPFNQWIYASKNVTQIESNIQTIIKNGKNSRHKVKNAYKWVENKTWENLTKKYLQLWQLS